LNLPAWHFCAGNEKPRPWAGVFVVSVAGGGTPRCCGQNRQTSSVRTVCTYGWVCSANEVGPTTPHSAAALQMTVSSRVP